MVALHHLHQVYNANAVPTDTAHHRTINSLFGSQQHIIQTENEFNLQAAEPPPSHSWEQLGRFLKLV